MLRKGVLLLRGSGSKLCPNPTRPEYHSQAIMTGPQSVLVAIARPEWLGSGAQDAARAHRTRTRPWGPWAPTRSHEGWAQWWGVQPDLQPPVRTQGYGPSPEPL